MKYNIDISLNKQQELTDLHSSSKSASIAASVAEQRVLCNKNTYGGFIQPRSQGFSHWNWEGRSFPAPPNFNGKSPGNEVGFYWDYLSTESFVPTPPAK